MSGIFDAVADLDAAAINPTTGTLRAVFIPNGTTGGAGDFLHPNRAATRRWPKRWICAAAFQNIERATAGETVPLEGTKVLGETRQLAKQLAQRRNFGLIRKRGKLAN